MGLVYLRQYQVFDLVPDERLAEPNPQAWEDLSERLIKKGYDVLKSETTINGVPSSVMVGEVRPDSARNSLKEDFYDIAEEAGLRFRSGTAYTMALKLSEKNFP